MEEIELDSLRLSAEEHGRIEDAKRATRRKGKPRQTGDWFIWGPIPGEYVARAARLPGKSLTLWLALWSEHFRRKGKPLRMTRELLHRFNITPDSAHRALEYLERAELLTAKRGRGKLATVQLLLEN